jgi:hypothetical protein
MPTAITSSGITFDDATTQTTSATAAAAIGATQLATDAVTTAKIADANVTTAKLASNAVTAAKLDSVGGGAGVPPVYGCRAWVNFDTTRDSSGASNTNNTNRFIRAGGNVTSVLKNGAGDYTITFTTAMPDTNYAAVGSASYTYPVTNVFDVFVPYYSVAPTTTALRVGTGNGGSTRDSANVVVSVFR